MRITALRREVLRPRRAPAARDYFWPFAVTTLIAELLALEVIILWLAVGP